jgi:GGDEF domain-containing protein
VKITTGSSRIGAISWILEAWRLPDRTPPVGSNQELALLLLRFLILVAMVSATLMMIAGLLIDSVSSVSVQFAGFFSVFLITLFLAWHRLPLTALRAGLMLGLLLYQARWVSAWLVLPPEEVPVASIAGIVYTPMLLLIIGLMEGQKRGVVIGLVVALAMGASATVGSFRPEMSTVALDDPRLGALIFVLIAVYVFIQNAWSAQQTLIEERGFESAIMQASVNEDEVTGLLNRRGLDIAVTGWISRRRPFGVMLIALDSPTSALSADESSKNSSDFIEQDAVESDDIPPNLPRIAQLISSRVPSSDSVGRWSSNEFLVVCRETDPRALTISANGIRSFIEEQSIKQDKVTTVSVGLSLFPLFEPFEVAIDRAQQAMQEAQAAGANCVRSYWSS